MAAAALFEDLAIGMTAWPIPGDKWTSHLISIILCLRALAQNPMAAAAFLEDLAIEMTTWSCPGDQWTM